MNLTVRFLGLELFSVDLTADEQADEDFARDLSGGTLGTDHIEPGPTDRYMGFTNGREDDG